MLARIGILGHVGNGNLGDEATIQAVLQNFRVKSPQTEFRAFTMNPDDTRERHGIPAFPVRRRPAAATGDADLSAAHQAAPGWRARLKQVPLLGPLLRWLRDGAALGVTLLQETAFLGSSWRRLGGLNALFVIGSGQLNDYVGGPWQYPYTLLKWTVLARLRGVRVGFVSVGAGPIATPLGRRFIRWALRLAAYRSLRDEDSRALLASLGVRGELFVTPDLAFSLDVTQTRTRPAGAIRVIGVNPLPYLDVNYWHASDATIYDRYVTNLAACVKWLADAGHEVVLFPMQLRVDPGVIADVERALAGIGGASGRVRQARVTSVADVFTLLSTLDAVVATRFHGMVAAFCSQLPAIGISYHPKAGELLTQMGQSSYGIDIERLDPDTFRATFSRLEADADRVRHDLPGRVAAARAVLAEQYDRLLAVFDRPGAAA
jgi:polysaccharide pyruvyl transferase WcaK-like protein